jgi:hypothetical protein
MDTPKVLQPSNLVKSEKMTMNTNVGAIVTGILFGIILIIMGIFSNYILDSKILYIALFAFMCIIILFLFIIFITTIQNIDNIQNNFNCNENKQYYIGDLIDSDILAKLHLSKTSIICNRESSSFKSISSYIKFICVLVIILLLIFIGGLLKDGFNFILKPFIILPVVILFSFIIFALQACFNFNIYQNSLLYECDKKITVRAKIDEVNTLSTPITADELNKINKGLNSVGLTIDSFICDNDAKTIELQPNTNKTTDSLDGLLIYTYIITLFLLIGLGIAFILNSDDDNTLMNGVIGFILSCMTLAGIIYPSSKFRNDKNPFLTTALVSTILPTILFIIIIIYMKFNFLFNFLKK